MLAPSMWITSSTVGGLGGQLGSSSRRQASTTRLRSMPSLIVLLAALSPRIASTTESPISVTCGRPAPPACARAPSTTASSNTMAAKATSVQARCFLSCDRGGPSRVCRDGYRIATVASVVDHEGLAPHCLRALAVGGLQGEREAARQAGPACDAPVRKEMHASWQRSRGETPPVGGIPAFGREACGVWSAHVRHGQWCPGDRQRRN